MPLSAPTDVDVTFGYEDGSLRTYTVPGFVAGTNMKVMSIRPHTGRTAPPVLSSDRTSEIPLPFPFDPTIVAANAFVWTGLGFALYHTGGYWALWGAGVILMWWRQIWMRARKMNGNDKPSETP